eukprot:TRINITY_DN42206_c0_g1_i1.p4 TRINITY_DN42206_c0_g1~~TRINITY_DN42206_c0_g1_i1.p4  ORF type:complete len:119 (-),score=15.19 TRINITY_DN42206_c0_g1_i1:27-383(-)
MSTLLTQKTKWFGFLVGFIYVVLPLIQTQKISSNNLQNKYTKNQYNTENNPFYDTFNSISYYENTSNVATNEVGARIVKNNNKNYQKKYFKNKKKKYEIFFFKLFQLEQFLKERKIQC